MTATSGVTPDTVDHLRGGPIPSQVVSDHTLSTAGTLVQILQSPPALTPNTVPLPMATTAQEELSKMTLPNLEAQTLALLNGDDSNLSFENGIEATDMGSLLAQFEAAEGFNSQITDSTDTVSLQLMCDITDSLGLESAELPSAHATSTTSDLVYTTSDLICATSDLVSMDDALCNGFGLTNDVQNVSLNSEDSEVRRLLQKPVKTPINGTILSTHAAQKMEVPAKIPSAMDQALPPTNCAPAPIHRTGSVSSNSSQSTETAPSTSEEPSKPVTKKRRLNVKQYHQRRLNNLDKENSDSQDSLGSQAAQKPDQVNANFFKVIVDHDYCQNTPSIASSTAQAIEGPSVRKSPQKESKPKKGKSERNGTLKSLLLNKNLSDELKIQAVEDRAVTRRNMSTPDLTSRAIETPPSRAKSPWRRGRKRDHASTNEVDSKDAVMDKLPSYCTTLALQPIPGMSLKHGTSSSKFSHQDLPDRDRDPSPERSEPVFNKVPAYFSDFTNSTKYDELQAGEVLNLEELKEEPYPWDTIRSCLPSRQSSRCNSPWIEVRSGHHPASGRRKRWRSRSRHYRRRQSHSGSSRSSSCSSCSSSSSSCGSSCSRSDCSRSRSRSNSRTRQRPYSRSHSRTRTRSRRRKRSKSRGYHSSRSRSRSVRLARSRSCGSYCSRSRSRSYSPPSRRIRAESSSSEDSNGHRRSRYLRTRHRSRSNSLERWRLYREKMQKKRQEEKLQQMEERRIMYVGRIPNGTLRQDLRRKFGSFGEIEEVSVHFREHGDNYGFVTFVYTCDAYAAIEQGNSIRGCEDFDLCFGGRRQFCRETYADLDGNKEEEEEFGPVISGKSFDFDSLLKQATKSIKK